MYSLEPLSEDTYVSVLEACMDYCRERGDHKFMHVPSWEQLLKVSMDQECAYVVLKEGELAGFMISLLHPHHLNGNLTCLSNMAIYVKPEHRNTKVLVMLLNQFREKAGTVEQASISLGEMANVSERSMNKFGFKKQEVVYTKEQ